MEFYAAVLQLVRLLADGQFHSGDELGEALGVGRAAVWKQVKKLHDVGIDVFSVKGKGYRLSEPLELLDSELVRSALAADAKVLLSQLAILGSIPSTNDVALSHAASPDSRGYACFAEQQTQGRGRRGRAWVSPFGVNVYLSVVWHFHSGAAALEGLSIATGVAVAQTLSALGCDEVKLKWPNDILIANKKVGGVLLEMAGDPAGHCQVVVGVGLNMKMPSAAGESIDQPFTFLEEQQVDVSRNQLAGALLSNVLLMLQGFEQSGFARYRPYWQGLDAYDGKEVELHMGANTVTGIARGVDESGGLRLMVDGVETVYKGGEISLRPAS